MKQCVKMKKAWGRIRRSVILSQAGVISEEMALEQIVEESDESSHKVIWGKSVQGRGNSKDNGHESELNLKCSKTNPQHKEWGNRWKEIK